MTTSLRGLAAGTLTVQVLTEGVHSGDASGVVPSSFRILRTLLDRLEDRATGHVHPQAFHVAIPDERVRQARAAAEILGDIVIGKYPFAGGTQPMVTDRAEALLNRTWRPALSVIGADGLPSIANAGNVLRPQTSLKLSLRLPPPVDGETRDADDEGAARGRSAVRRDGHVRAGPGRDRLERAADRAMARGAMQEASQTFYAKPAAAMGEGGTIPFMGMLGKQFPAGAVPDHRRARAALERARPERVPARAVREEADRLRGVTC